MPRPVIAASTLIASPLIPATLVALAGCVPDNAGPAASAASSRPVVTEAGATTESPVTDAAVTAQSRADAGRTPMPDGPAKWRSVPREQNGFYAVLDGICSQLAATRLGKDVVVHYGGNNDIYKTGRRQGAASFIALRDEGLEALGDPMVAAPTGLAGRSADDFWVADSTGSRSAAGVVLHRHTDGQWKKYRADQTNIHAWVDGGIIGSLGFAMSTGELWVEGSTTKPPVALYADMPYPALSAFPTGDVLIIGRRSPNGPTADGPLFARHWAPGKKITEHPLEPILPDPDGSASWPRLTEIAPNEVYIVRGSRIARWDGAALRALGRTAKGQPIELVRHAGPDDLWVVTEQGDLQRMTSEGVSTVATPEPIVDIDGVEQNDIWIVGKSGKLFRREGELWKTMPLPPPVFSAGAVGKAKRVVVVAPGDVLLITMYWEKGLGWKDQELHTSLYRTKPVKETLRCNEPDPENNNIHLGRGFQSWPPMATAECKTPYAVLARRSNAIKKTDDWPRLRAALKGHTELGSVVLEEFVSGDRTFVGAKAKDLETAKSIVTLVAKHDRLRPEIVCGEPEPKRSLAIDLATGTATVQ